MIKFKLTRDQARMVNDRWLPFMIMNAESQLLSNAGFDQKYLSALMVLSTLKKVKKTFEKKLLNETNKLSFTFEIHYCAAFYVYLMKRPIDPQLVYAITFRQKLCDELHGQLFAGRPPAHEGAPVTMVDYEMEILRDFDIE